MSATNATVDSEESVGEEKVEVPASNDFVLALTEMAGIYLINDPEEAVATPQLQNEHPSRTSDPQDAVNKALDAPSYRPHLALIPPSVIATAISSRDPATLPCLEFLGDSRFGFEAARLQTQLFPDATLRELNRGRAAIVSNRTFQRIGHKSGVDVEPIEPYNKEAGDALEIFAQLVAKSRPEAVGPWVADILTPVVRASMGEQGPQPSTASAVSHPVVAQDPRARPTSKPSKRQAKSANKLGKSGRTPAKAKTIAGPATSVSNFPTSTFTFATDLA
ncbi:hypothetical protein B0H16DRAFT_234610 [Mycena metata]|uniref:RNase III domain-containing protein n=1 Tax=Mycena metata TaxID=1033252 RepID=A0AAD7JSW3_9AGAR|nr:hypothetical protein B0H16DRAFT_234610 [Mycena metata]